jgi:hypothetical protein
VRAAFLQIGFVLTLGVALDERLEAHPIAHADPACRRVSVTAVPGSGASSRTIRVRITNDDEGGFTAAVRRDLRVERQVGGAWQPVVTSGFMARASCATAPPECVTIEPHSTLEVVPWDGVSGDAQCECEHCADAPAGRYRIIADICGGCVGSHSYASAPFDLPARSDSGGKKRN